MYEASCKLLFFVVIVMGSRAHTVSVLDIHSIDPGTQLARLEASRLVMFKVLQ